MIEPFANPVDTQSSSERALMTVEYMKAARTGSLFAAVSASSFIASQMGSTLLMCPTGFSSLCADMRISLLASSDVQYIPSRRELKWGGSNELNAGFRRWRHRGGVDGHVGLLTISNARRKNALNLAMWQA